MAFLHLIGYSLKDEKKDDDCSDEMSPNVDSLIMRYKQWLKNTFRIIMVQPISFENMLIIFKDLGGFVKVANVLFLISTRGLRTLNLLDLVRGLAIFVIFDHQIVYLLK